MPLYAPGAVWDERRNTSRNFAPAPGAVDRALRACAELRRRDPELVRWLEEGHPTLTEAEHRERFGKDYERRGSIPARAASGPEETGYLAQSPASAHKTASGPMQLWEAK